jgi:DNA polymerase
LLEFALPVENLIKNLILLKRDGIDYIPFRDRKKETYELLRKKVFNCKMCPLCKERKNVVFGEGDVNANLMFIGEAPGANEDIQGKPFVGEAGRLLSKIINAMGLTREKVYIANILKCRPPGNRDPLPEEITQCYPFLISQIKIVSPVVICTLGKISTQTLLRTSEPISKLRGKIFDFNGIKTVPTFHPSHLLHHPENKRLVWQDMQIIMKLLKNL